MRRAVGQYDSHVSEEHADQEDEACLRKDVVNAELGGPHDDTDEVHLGDVSVEDEPRGACDWEIVVDVGGGGGVGGFCSFSWVW